MKIKENPQPRAFTLEVSFNELRAIRYATGRTNVSDMNADEVPREVQDVMYHVYDVTDDAVEERSPYGKAA